MEKIFLANLLLIMSIQLHILPEKQQIIYNGLREASWISQYDLAGGTALALQIGLKIE